jgi:hypothetical protein
MTTLRFKQNCSLHLPIFKQFISQNAVNAGSHWAAFFKSQGTTLKGATLTKPQVLLWQKKASSETI